MTELIAPYLHPWCGYFPWPFLAAHLWCNKILVFNIVAIECINYYYTDLYDQGRLIVIVNKIDNACRRDEYDYDDDGGESQLTREDIAHNVHKCIQEACNCFIPGGVVIPVCGAWASKANQLERRPDCDKIRREVIRILSMLNDGPIGQGESSESTFEEVSSQDLVTMLKSRSNIRELEKR